MSYTAFLGLSSLTEPNASTGTITYDGARPSSVTSPHGAVTTYAHTTSPPTVNAALSFTYGPAGSLTAMSWGHFFSETRTYNPRYQLTRLIVTGKVDLECRYSTTQNNGQITQMKDWISGEEVSYQYDLLSRLISAVTTGPEWGQSSSYDGSGSWGTVPSVPVGVPVV
jgi:hypothetical protein